MNMFKKCTCCGTVWENLEDLIRDGQVHIIGYQAALNISYEGLLFFVHKSSECGTTIALPISNFLDLYDGPTYSTQGDCGDEINGLCQSFYDVGTCTVECEMQWANAIIHVLENQDPEELVARLEAVVLQRQCA